MLPDIFWLSQPAPLRPDEDLLADVYDRLWLDPTTRASERHALSGNVRAGQVFLTGHVTSVRYRQHVVDLLRGVRGVQAIHNDLIADPTLQVEVAQALAADERTSPSSIRVGVSHGWILLAGEVPDLSTCLAAEQVAASVQGARGVLGLPHPPAGGVATRRPIQPQVGQAVHAQDGRAGLVAHVIIDRQNRLVSHVVVAGDPEVNWVPRPGAWLVPIEAVAQATDGGIFLSDTVRALVERPPYDADAFQRPQADWRLPYPYKAGEVYWLAGLGPLAPPLPVDERLVLTELSHLLPHTAAAAQLGAAAA